MNSDKDLEALRDGTHLGKGGQKGLYLDMFPLRFWATKKLTAPTPHTPVVIMLPLTMDPE